MSERAEENVLPANPERSKGRMVPNYALLAQMVVREGKAFRESALAAGYSLTVAESGLKRLMERTKPVADAIRRESERLLTLDKLKPLAVARLYSEITNPRSSNGIKAIELAGRFKETDWWVRNVDVQVGVMAVLGDNAPLAAGADAITQYEEPEKT